LLSKCLERDRDLRCQTAAELRTDLKRLKRDTSSGTHRISDSDPVSDAEPHTPSATSSASSVSGVVPPTGCAPSAIGAQPSSGSSWIATIAKEHKLGATTVALIVLALVGGPLYGLRGAFSHTAPRPFAQFSISQVTNSGTATLAAISP